MTASKSAGGSGKRSLPIYDPEDDGWEEEHDSGPERDPPTDRIAVCPISKASKAYAAMLEACKAGWSFLEGTDLDVSSRLKLWKALRKALQLAKEAESEQGEDFPP